MLIIMNFLLFAVFFGGWAFAKSAWSEKQRLKAVAIMVVDIIVCIVILMMKESMKKEIRESYTGLLFF